MNASRFAGAWYPTDPARLDALLGQAARGVEAVGDNFPSRTVERPSLAVLPHAGLSYSARGQVAFWGRHADWCREGPEAVIILAPSHYVPLKTDTTVGAAFSGHETTGAILPGIPLCLGDREDPVAVEQEHAVEILLPAISRYGVTAPLGAVLTATFSGVSAVRAATARMLDRLSGTFDPRRILWLVSSDFTHYGSRFRYEPDGSGTYGQVGPLVEERDRRIANAAASGDLDRFWESIREPNTVCGRFAIALALAVREHLRGAESIGTILSYYTSADLAPEPSREREFVCYATIEAGEP